MSDLQSRIAALSPDQRVLLESRLAQMVAAREHPAGETIPLRDRSKPALLATAQQREWAVERVRPANNITGAFRVEGALDTTLLGTVLTEVVERHEVLRSTVEILGGVPVQVVHPVTAVEVPVVDLTHLPADAQRQEVRRRSSLDVSRRFDPEDPVRLRVTLLRLAEETHVALFCNDHASGDAWSLAIVVREVVALYDKHRDGGPGLLPPPIQFADFAAWQRERYGEERVEEEVRHWRDTLEGIPVDPALPADRPYPARPTFAGEILTRDLPAGLAAEVAGFTARESVSLVMVVLATCAVMLRRLREQSDVVVGSFVSGRTRVETEQLIGCFANPLPLRMTVRDDETVRDVLLRARDTVATALDHQDVPFDRVVEALGLGRDASQRSLSALWINVLSLPDMRLDLPGLRISSEPLDAGPASVDLTLTVVVDAAGLHLQWQYMTEVFDAGTVDRFADYFEAVLLRLVQAPDTVVGDVRLDGGPGPERSPSRDEGHDAVAPGFLELFDRRVALAPGAPAVVHGDTVLSYLELDGAADRLARRLRSRGAGPEQTVGVLVDRSPRFPLAILGVLKSGGAFVPLDPGYPPERIALTLADAGVQVLVTERGLLAGLEDAGVTVPAEVVLLDDGPDATAGAADGAAAAFDVDVDVSGTPDPGSAAYVIYTSGSTGRPKGVVVEHRSLAVFARDVVDRLGLGAGDRFLQFASAGFDVVVEEIFPTWLAGGAVVVPDQHIISGQVDLVELVARDRVTVAELPTAYWHEWVRELDREGRDLPACLRLVIIGGERVLPERLRLWRRHGIPLLHVYGLTEATVSSTFYRLEAGQALHDLVNLPIGTPLPSADLRVLDSRLRPVPPGGSGELYIGGVGVARGYLGRPGLTAQRFVADPDPHRPPGRLYRTGDLVRERPDGNLEFIARVDTQIKIRGFRVEPAEIESALGRHPAVLESVVAAYEPSPGDRRLVAYVVPRTGESPTWTELRRFLERELPPYMVPSTYVPLDALPLSANGKLARDRLPAPDGTTTEPEQTYTAPRTPAEQALADIVAGVVGLGRVGVDDNFFEIGGDSILAIQVVARAQQEGLGLTPYDVFVNPTVAALAEVVTAGTAVDADQGEVVGPLPPSPMQRRFAACGVRDPARWSRSARLRLSGAVPADVARTAVGHVLAHHDGLRQRFLLAGERTRVRIAPVGDETPFEELDLTGLGEDEAARRADEVVADLRGRLDLAVGPMVRAALLRFGGGRPDELCVVAHHLVADETSLQIVLQDLETAIVQLSGDEPLRFLPKTTSWQSWCRRLESHATSEQIRSERAVWADTIGSASGRLPRDGAPDDLQALDPASCGHVVVAELDRTTSAAVLDGVTRAVGCSVEELLLSALGCTLSSWTGSDAVLVDIERRDRVHLFDDVDLRRTVGWFDRVHPVVLSCPADGGWRDVLSGVARTLREVPGGGAGWQLLLQGDARPPEPVVDLVFGFAEVATTAATRVFPVVVAPDGDERPPAFQARYAMAVEVGVRGGVLQVRWHYREGVHERTTVQSLVQSYLEQLGGLLDDGQGPDAELSAAHFPLARIDEERLARLLDEL